MRGREEVVEMALSLALLAMTIRWNYPPACKIHEYAGPVRRFRARLPKVRVRNLGALGPSCRDFFCAAPVRRLQESRLRLPRARRRSNAAAWTCHIPMAR